MTKKPRANPDSLPEQEHEIRLKGRNPAARSRLRIRLATACGSPRRTISSRLVAPAVVMGRGHAATYLVVPWEDALAWATENCPRLVPTETTAVFEIDDLDAMRRHVTALHDAAAGHDGVLMVLVRSESANGWEQPGVTFDPYWPGQIDEIWRRSRRPSTGKPIR